MWCVGPRGRTIKQRWPPRVHPFAVEPPFGRWCCARGPSVIKMSQIPLINGCLLNVSGLPVNANAVWNLLGRNLSPVRLKTIHATERCCGKICGDLKNISDIIFDYFILQYISFSRTSHIIDWQYASYFPKNISRWERPRGVPNYKLNIRAQTRLKKPR